MDDMNDASESTDFPQLIRGLKRLVVGALVASLLASSASAAGSVLSFFHGKDKRSEICETVSAAFDNYTDALVATVATSADTPAQIEERARKTAFLKRTFHETLKTCD